MEELLARVSESAGVEPEVAQKSVGLILDFLRKEGPQSEIEALFARAPGAAELAAAAEQSAGESAGGGLMGLAGRLSGIGLGMGQMTAVGRQVLSYAREKGGDDLIGQVVAGIPGLGQFL